MAMDETSTLKFRKIEPFGLEVELTSPELSAAQPEALRRHYREDGERLRRSGRHPLRQRLPGL